MTISRSSAIAAVAIFAGTVITLACGAGGGGGRGAVAVPIIQNINSSTTPTSPVNLTIEINGSGFQAAPGKVVFTQNNITASVVPSSSAWSDTGIIVVVPTGNGSSNFTVPGAVSVAVETSGGTSGPINVSVLPTFTFNPSAMAWTTTTPLPSALTGLRAIGVPGTTTTSAFVVVTGGFDGNLNGLNRTTVLSNTLHPNGTVGSNWTIISTNPLPAARAHHIMVEADDTNSLVPAGKRYIYVIGGQEASTDIPGGTSTIYMASLDPTTGRVSSWTTLTNTLPQKLVGMAAAVHNGYVYVAGGLTTTGATSSAVYSAPINPDGTVGVWTTATNSLPTPAAFGTMFLFGGRIYWINGDQANSMLPNAQIPGTMNVYGASAVRGVVGTWGLNSNLTVHNRGKGLLFTAYGQVISAEGVYDGSPGSGEMETSTVNADGTLNAWNGMSGSSTQVPKANVYNSAGFVSPLVTPSDAPRFLILGGQSYTLVPPGALSNAVYYNTAP